MPLLVLVAAAWGLGLVVAHHLLAPAGVSPSILIVLSVVALAMVVIGRRDHAWRLTFGLLLVGLLGALRYQASVPRPGPETLASHNDTGEAILEGVVARYPDVRGTDTRLVLDARWLEHDGERSRVQGLALVGAARYPEYQYGDRLRVSGVLETPPERADFSYREYLARRGIGSLVSSARITRLATGQGNPLWAGLYAVKDAAAQSIGRLLPDPEAALLQGIVLGIQSNIPAGLYDEFNTTGTSHIIVISGANIVVLAALFERGFRRLVGKRRAAWLTVAGILLYVLLAGAESPAVRAGLMGGLYVVARRLGRASVAAVALCASAVLLSALNPMVLWDAAFQLSVTATLGLILLAPPLERWFGRAMANWNVPSWASGLPGALGSLLAVTLAAQILTVPLIAYRFGRLSLVALPANLLIGPVQPLIMSTGGAATILGLVPFLETIARAVAWVPWMLLAYTVSVVQWLAAWPRAAVEIAPADAAWLAVGWLGAVAGVWLAGPGRAALRRLRGAAGGGRWVLVLGAGVLGTAVLVGLALCELPDGRLHVAVLDVGQGDAILITTPDGRQILVDGGPDPIWLSAALGRQMPFWDRSLDLVVSTHADADHLTGLAEVLERYRVAAWMDNGQAADDPVSEQCRALLEREGIPRHTAAAGDRLDLGDDLVLEVLHPRQPLLEGSGADANNNSLVTRLRWRQMSFLLAGDVEQEAEQVLLQSGQELQADVLKVAHHGSDNSSTAEFLAAVRPSVAVISVGAGNRAGHPASSVLERLSQLGGVTILRTDEVGTVALVTDGQRLWVQAER